MRFLIGIITGAVITLLTATVLDAPTRPTLERFANQAQSLWQATRDATGAALFEHAESIGTAPSDVAVLEAPAEEAEETAPTPATPAAQTLTGRAAFEPLARLADDPPGVVEPAFLDALLEEADRESGSARSTASVWAPFHSEVSARGFAQRLSAEIGHPFTVERTGPGTYQVVFDYVTPVERTDLESAIAEVTGR